jgi:hypothetical protein
MNRHLNGNRFRRATRLLVAAFAITFMLLADFPASAAPATKSSSKKSTATKSSTARKTTTAKKSTASASNSTGAKSGTTAKKTTASSSRKSGSRKAATRNQVASSGARRTTRRRTATTTRPHVPMQPSSERLTEVQTALANAGYLETTPNGRWDDSSIAAMKRFQQEHSIPVTGKINALSLIALGLGPKRGPSPGNTSVLTSSDTETATEAETNFTTESNR